MEVIAQIVFHTPPNPFKELNTKSTKAMANIDENALKNVSKNLVNRMICVEKRINALQPRLT